MKKSKIIIASLSIIIISMILSGCGNVNGSVSYSMGVGYGYPMYYGSGYRNNNVVVVRPPNRPSRPPISRPTPRGR